MQWSGNFSLEDHLALAETLSEEDDPHLITIESFSSAVSVGSQVVGALRDERGSREARARQEGGRAGASSGMRADGDETTNASDKCDRIATAGEDVDVQSCTGCDVVEFGDDGGGFGRRRGDCSRQPAAAWEATLERAAAEARWVRTNFRALLRLVVVGCGNPHNKKTQLPLPSPPRFTSFMLLLLLLWPCAHHVVNNKCSVTSCCTINSGSLGSMHVLVPSVCVKPVGRVYCAKLAVC